MIGDFWYIFLQERILQLSHWSTFTLPPGYFGPIFGPPPGGDCRKTSFRTQVAPAPDAADSGGVAHGTSLVGDL